MNIMLKNESGSIGKLIKVYNDGYFYRYLICNTANSSNHDFSVMELVSKFINHTEADSVMGYEITIRKKEDD